MTSDNVPLELIARFRSLSLERIERMEGHWLDLTQGADKAGGAELHRDLHTLKGDARMIGFADVNLLCHRLEDVLAYAQRAGYRVPEDVDLVVTMGFRFAAMLLRKKAGTSLGGIDLAGFVDQIDTVMRDVHTQAQDTVESAATVSGSVEKQDRLSPQTRLRLADAATDVFLEHLGATGSSRARLRAVWQTLADQVVALAEVDLAPLVRRHAHAASTLADELGKQVNIQVDVGPTLVRSEVAEMFDASVLHVLRNAIDHGIEHVDLRRFRGKAPVGEIRVIVRDLDGTIEIEVADDGSGVDLGEVRRRALELGIVDVATAERATEEQQLRWMFAPGFTTASKVTEVSGRGIGLDAVFASMQRVDGAALFRTRAGAGSVVTLRVPSVRARVAVHYFQARGSELQLAVPSTWDASEASPAGEAVDALGALAIAPPSTKPSSSIDVRLRRDGVDLAIAAASSIRSGSAERICPTSESHPVEVVLLDERESLLLRPHLLRRG